MRRKLYAGLFVTLAVSLILGIVACSNQPTASTSQPSSTSQASSSTTQAPQKVYNLKYTTADSLPGIPWVAQAHWMDLVEQRSGGRVKFERFYGGALGQRNEMLDMVSSGTVDFAGFHPVAFPDQMPLHAWMADELFFSPQQAIEGANALEFDVQASAQVLKKEYDKYGITPLYWLTSTGFGGLFGYQTTKLSDMQDKKIAATGKDVTTAKVFGGVNVAVPPPGFYESLQRGVIDGVLTSVDLATNFKLEEVSKSYIWFPRTSDGPPLWVNNNTWNSLPADIRDIMTATSQDAIQLNLDQTNNRKDEINSQFSQLGLKLTAWEDVDPTEQQKANANWENVLGQQWLTDMASKGVGDDAETLYDAYQTYIKSH